jgi:hypothetical protein
MAAISRVRKKGLASFFWPVIATLSAELSAFFLTLSMLESSTRKPLADLAIGFGQEYGIDATPVFQRFYDDHHLLLIALIFLGLALLPLIIAGLIRKNRLVLRLATPAKPAVLEVTIAAGANREALFEALGKIIASR